MECVNKSKSVAALTRELEKMEMKWDDGGDAPLDFRCGLSCRWVFFYATDFLWGGGGICFGSLGWGGAGLECLGFFWGGVVMF